MQHASVDPVRLRLHSTQLSCDVLRIAAYRARCGCGWRGPSRDHHADARADGREHVRLEHAAGR